MIYLKAISSLFIYLCVCVCVSWKVGENKRGIKTERTDLQLVISFVLLHTYDWFSSTVKFPVLLVFQCGLFSCEVNAMLRLISQLC